MTSTPQLISSRQYDFKDILIDIFIRHVMPALPRSYWHSLQCLSRGLRRRGQELLHSSPVVDFINFSVKHRYNSKQYEPFRVVLRALQQHEGTVPVPVSQEEVQLQPLPGDESEDKITREAILDQEFPWITRIVMKRELDEGRSRETEELAMGIPDFVCPNVRHLRLPSGIPLPFDQFRALLSILPNLQSITLCRSDVHLLHPARAALRGRFSHMHSQHEKLEEIIFVQCEWRIYRNSPRTVVNMFQRLDTNDNPTFPALRSIQFVACENVETNFEDEQQQNQNPAVARRRVGRAAIANGNAQASLFGLRVWDQSTKSLVSKKNPSAHLQVDIIHEKKTPKKGIYTSRREAQDKCLDLSCATYLLQNIGLDPYKKSDEDSIYEKKTLVDRALSPSNSCTEEQFDEFMRDNDGLIDLFYSLSSRTWVECIQQNNMNHVAVLARLARRYCNGQILNTKALKTLIRGDDLSDYPFLLKQLDDRISADIPSRTEKNSKSVALLLRTLSDNAWDMYHADYVKAALSDHVVLRTLLELDQESQRKKGITDEVESSERHQRFCELLLTAAKQRSFESIPIIIELAGAHYVNIVLDKSVGTVISHALKNSIVPMGYVEYLLQKKPLDVRSKRQQSYLHIAALNACERDCFTVILGLVPDTIDINALDSEGNTMLHHLCTRGKVAAAKLAVMKGANPNIKNSKGYYPADYLAVTIKNANGTKSPIQYLQIPNELMYPGFSAQSIDESKMDIDDDAQYTSEATPSVSSRGTKRKREDASDDEFAAPGLAAETAGIDELNAQTKFRKIE